MTQFRSLGRDSNLPLSNAYKRGKGSSLRAKLEGLLLSKHMYFDVIFQENGKHQVRWLRASGSEFREPFFGRTVERVRRLMQERAWLTTELDVLLRQGSQINLYPDGFIFHIGRCGSTLLSNMLKAIKGAFVLSEPNLPITSMLATPGLCEFSQWIDLTRASIGALGRSAPSSTERFFIKFFNPHILAIPVIRQAIPGVPEIFLYRDPVEVVVSIAKDPLMPWLWEEYLTGLPLSSAVERPLIELVARIVGRQLQAMNENARDDTLLLNYNQIGPLTADVLLKHFRIEGDSETVASMTSMLDYYSKARDSDKLQKYVSDTELKQRHATPSIHDAVSEFALEAYLRLERLRISRMPS